MGDLDLSNMNINGGVTAAEHGFVEEKNTHYVGRC
jgi:hypothetical protein